MVRQFDRAVGNEGTSSTTRQDISDGIAIEDGINLDNSITWDLRNEQNIPVGSGTYIILVDAPGIGQEVVKSVVFMRPTDISNF